MALYDLVIPPHSQSPAAECLRFKGQGTAVRESPPSDSLPVSSWFSYSLLLTLLVYFAKDQIQRQLGQDQRVTPK